MRLTEAFSAFKAEPTNITAGRYLQALKTAESNDEIDDDGFYNGLELVEDYLFRGKGP